MKKSVLLMIALVLTSCGKHTPVDTVGSLVAHPHRLHEIERQCSNGSTKISPAECNAASEARRRLFLGNGPQYTPPKNAPKF